MKTRELLQMRHSQPEELAKMLAYKAVRRGVWWLHAHARQGWYRNLFEPRAGRFVFRAQIGYDIGTVLTLAFEERTDLVDQNGYVNQYVVAKYFDLSRRTQRLLGFDTEWLSEKDSRLTREMLETAWQQTILSFERDSLPIRYRTAEEQRLYDEIADYDFVNRRPISRSKAQPGILRRIIDRLAA